MYPVAARPPGPLASEQAAALQHGQPPLPPQHAHPHGNKVVQEPEAARPPGHPATTARRQLIPTPMAPEPRMEVATEHQPRRLGTLRQLVQRTVRIHSVVGRERLLMLTVEGEEDTERMTRQRPVRISGHRRLRLAQLQEARLLLMVPRQSLVVMHRRLLQVGCRRHQGIAVVGLRMMRGRRVHELAICSENSCFKVARETLSVILDSTLMRARW